MLSACEALYVAKHGRKPADVLESLALVRKMLEETGIKHTIEQKRLIDRSAAPPPPLPPHLIMAALELMGAEVSDGDELPTQLTPSQLRALHEQVDACLVQEEHDESATDGGASYAPVLPREIELALQSEFRTRVGSGGYAEPQELQAQLAPLGGVPP